jgi:membrane dipeptidase
MSRITRLLSIIVALLLLTYLAVVFIVPGKVDKNFNTSTLLPPYQVSASAQNIYNKLPFVADLHCDALLWKRNLLKEHDFGHVDIPRMIKAQMSLQAFTIVSKTPKNMNFDNNTGDTDNITTLFIAEGRPLKTWYSLKNRALDQCERLHSFAKESGGDFRVITSSSELNNYIEDRSKNKNIAAGFLGVEGMQVLEGKLDNVDAMYDAGIRMMAPVHFFDNKLGR